MARYREPEEGKAQGNPWSYRTRKDGLPSDQTNCIAVATDGTVYVGTDCDGLAIGTPTGDYRSWRALKADVDADKYKLPKGGGFPSSQIHDVLVGKDGTVYVATHLGLVRSVAGGKAWEYLRGRDYDDKVRNREVGPLKSWKPAAKVIMDSLLPEDYVTCLAENSVGQLLVGFRQQGYLVVDPERKTSTHAKATKEVPVDYVRAFLPTKDGLHVGSYGAGYRVVENSIPQTAQASVAEQQSAKPAGVPRHPTPAEVPSDEELKSFVKMPGKKSETPAYPSALSLSEDWSTQGDWFGRYGNANAVLCAMDAPLNYYLGGQLECIISASTGVHGERGEALRHWCHWKETTQRRCLYSPLIGHRRQSKWDDHGEAYPMSHEGPDVWIRVKLLEGTYRVGCYFVNKDGQSGHNRFRDYLMEVRESHEDWKLLRKKPVLAKARVHDFWGGVHKSFLLQGPGTYAIRVAKNDSFNTIVSSVFVDKLAGPPDRSDRITLPYTGNLGYKPASITTNGRDAAESAMTALLKERATWSKAIHILPFGRQIYRRVAKRQPDKDLSEWRWALALWEADDIPKHEAAMERLFNAHLELNPRLKEKYKKK